MSNPGRTPLTIASLTSVLGMIALPATADLVLDPAGSSVTLLSTKVLADGTASVTERFTFADIAGAVDEAGAARVTIALDSVDTGVPIRDGRLSEVLFESAAFPEATIVATVPEDALDGTARRLDLPIELTLHGKTQPIVVPVLVEGDDAGVMVTATEPVLLDAAAYDLDGGIGKLAALAELLHIPVTVPISFSLTFVDGTR